MKSKPASNFSVHPVFHFASIEKDSTYRAIIESIPDENKPIFEVEETGNKVVQDFSFLNEF